MNPIPDSYRALLDRLDLHDRLPYTSDWSAAADFLQLIVEHCLSEQPTTILECSSGLTTLMLARCCQLNRLGHVYSLENGAEYAASTVDSLKAHRLEGFASVIHAPLEQTPVGRQVFQWYTLDRVSEKAVDMLVIDGPPGFIQPLSRYPALPRLYERLAERCTVFLDDAARADEQEIIRRWLSEYPACEHEFVATERGCSVLRINKNPQVDAL